MAELADGASHAAVARCSGDSPPTVISITGEVDMSNVEPIEAELGALLGDQPEHVVFDLSDLTFIDSSGIAILLRAAEKTGRLDLRNPSSTVERIIHATGLADVLHIES